MGAWGFGIFENDTVWDFADEVSRGGGISLIEETLDRLLACENGYYLDAPDAETCLAGAEIIARLWGSPAEGTSTVAIDAWIKNAQVAVSGELIKKAKRAIARILLEPSEIIELWKDSDHFDDWRQGVERLSARLESAA
jgi:hypothetical protein